MKAKRNASVELMRLFGILMILGFHNMQTELVLDVPDDFFMNFWTCFYCDCVPMFFMITGFYLFNEKNTYQKVVKRLITGIVIPTLLLFAAYFYLFEWITGTASFTDSIQHSLGDYYYVIRSLLTFQSPWPYTNHTWYLFLYTLAMLAWPAMKGLVDYLDKDVRRQAIFMAATLVLFGINDLFSNAFLGFSYHSLGGAAPAFFMVIWGHILYQHRERFTGKRIYALIAFVAMVLNNLLRERIVWMLYLHDGAVNGHIKNWYSAFGLVNPVLMMIIAFNIIDGTKDTCANRIILAIASINLPMYLLHQICIDWMTSSGIRAFTTQMVRSHIGGHAGDVVLTAVNTAVTAVLTVILVFAVRLFKMGFLKIKSARK